MKNKNGFIATSVMFSFFLVFILLTVLILASYTHYNVLLNNLNGTILTDLNDRVISKKYANLINVIRNGDIQNNGQWSYSNSTFERNTANNTYIKFNSGASSSFYQNTSTSQRFNGNSRKIYVSFNYERSFNVACTSEDFKVVLNTGSNTYDITTFSFDNNSSTFVRSGRDMACGNNFLNWTHYGTIITVNSNKNANQSTQFIASNIKNSVGVMAVNNVVVTDITALYNSGTTDAQMLQYLLKKLPYFTGEYSLPKI